MSIDTKKILIVEDEEDLCEILQFNLNKNGFHTEVVHSAEDALLKPIEQFDLILLDVMLGNLSGFDFAGIVREERNLEIPIIFLTAKDKETDILTGFSVDADDYVPKPFSISELIARIKAVLKRSQGKSNEVKNIIYGEIKLDIIKKNLMIENRKIDLTKKEFEILELLISNPGKIYSREDLLANIWGDEVVVSERTVDVNITRLRNKLGRYCKNLKNKTGFGYYLEL